MPDMDEAFGAPDLDFAEGNARPEFIADPYPLYQRLRADSPIHRLQRGGASFVLLTRHADVTAVLTDPRLGKQAPDPGTAPEAAAAPTRSMLVLDPPDHSRLRALATKAFTPRVVEALREHVTEIATALLDELEQHGDRRADLVADFAFPLPATVIAELLGVPLADRERFRGWSQRIVNLTDRGLAEDVRADALVAQRELRAYFAELIARRKGQAPRGDFLDRLLEAEEEGDRLTMDEVLAMCSLILVAGHETTTNLIANGTLTLLRHPDELRRLRENPSLVANAVEELLRFESPVQRTVRRVHTDLELSGAHLARGSAVVALLGAANRDPAVFQRPEALDLTRANAAHHVAFGRGVHYCLGAPLARLEAQVALPLLLQRLPRLSLLNAQPEWNNNATIRSLRHLPVAF